MDPVLTQLLAERLGLSEDEAAAFQNGNLSAALSSHLSDPLMAALVNSMMQGGPAEPEEEVARHEPAAERQDPERLLLQARRRIHQLNVMVRYIARVFGACAACWGQNKLCPVCEGSGRPGSGEPIEEEVLAWAIPTLRKLGMRVERIE